MKWLFSFAGWCLLLLAVSIWRLGWENHVLWAIRVFPAWSQGVPYFANKSLSALIYELYLGRVPLELDFSIPVVLSRLVSLLNLGIFCGTLYYFWRRNRSATGLVYELVAMAVVAIVIAPVAWRHHYLLTLLPLIFLWLRSKDAWRDWLVLAIFTLSTGLVFLDYVVVSIRNPLIDILATAVQPMTTLASFSVVCPGQLSRGTQNAP